MFTVAHTVDDVIDAVATYLQPFVGGATIVQAQANRVAMPANPCVVLTPLFHKILSTPFTIDDVANSKQSIGTDVQIDVQVDLYGVASGDQCRAIVDVFRTSYAVSSLPEWLVPLYSSDGTQSPLITGEQQYEARWTITLSLQYVAPVDVPMQFFNQASATLIAV